MATVVRQRWNSRSAAPALWAIAVIAFLVALVAFVHSATFPRAIARHPVRVEATVTESYINGLGGDPAVEYRYWVAGRAYSGSGDAALGPASASELAPGDQVAIEYAAGDPGESCTCDAGRDVPQSVSAAAVWAVVLSLPFLILVGRRARLARFRRPAWVRGVGGWIGFIGGLFVALVFGLVLLAYLLAGAAQP